MKVTPAAWHFGGRLANLVSLRGSFVDPFSAAACWMMVLVQGEATTRSIVVRCQWKCGEKFGSRTSADRSTKSCSRCNGFRSGSSPHAYFRP